MFCDPHLPAIPRPVEQTPRKRLTKAQRVFLLAAQDDCCGNCGTSLIWRVEGNQKVYGQMIDEHILRLFVAGGNEMGNRQLWCVNCSKAKTKAEAPENAKIRRLIKKADPAERRPSRIASRGFDKTLRKRMNGKVERL